MKNQPRERRTRASLLVTAFVCAVFSLALLGAACSRNDGGLRDSRAHAAGIPEESASSAHEHQGEGRPGDEGHSEEVHSAADHSAEDHGEHGHGDEGEPSDLDQSLDALLGHQCEHAVPTYTCDECRYEVGMVKVDEELLAAGGPLDTVRVRPRPVLLGSELNGEVRLDEERSVYLSPPAAGVVRAIRVDLGSRVRRGDVLYLVHSPEYSEAKAAHIRTGSALRLADATLARESDLYAKKICPRKDLLEAQAARDGAAAEARAARERLLAYGLPVRELNALAGDAQGSPASQSSTEGDLLAVRAPFAGTVLERNLNVGAAVEPGQELLLLGDTNVMWVKTQVHERDLAAILEAESDGEVQAQVTVSAFPGRAFSGKVDRVSGVLDESSRTVSVRVITANPESLLRPGMFARVRLLLPAKDRALALPEDAVLQDEGRSFVFLPARGEYFVRRPVKIGRAQDGWVEIRHGLTDGDLVVARGAFLLKSDVLRSKMGAGCAD